MKKIITSILILLTVVTSFYSCRKNDNPKLPEGIQTGVFPLLTQDPNGDELIQDVTAFSTAFTLGLYYPNPVPQKMDLQVIMNGNYQVVKTLQANITSFPTKINVTGTQLAQLFGLTPDQVAVGDDFTIGPDVTLQDGTVIHAFDYYLDGTTVVPISPYGADALNNPGANTTLTYAKVCSLDIDSLANVGNGGQLLVQDPDLVEATYPVTATVTDSIIKLKGYSEMPNMVLTIRVIPKSQTLVVDKQFLGPTIDGYSYTNWNVVGTGTVNACNNTMTLKLTFSVDQGSFAPITQTVVHP
ncbi:hypothetical protein DVR12_11690 [Chitinophaga silvatica]|uniref:Uncharacterized protein n=1 Tax=Chitinophaga silvatica TaxID=2282649 RepID=A0A3E1Y9R7_9BACT|nr:hypothetical protein [Chitinophaga silvatica]RFS22463.1 hypothetical protein DVR12_11690 [Chitinophaga silvatica]